MTIEYIRYRIPAGQRESFESAYTRAALSLDGSSHCHRYELARCVEEPECYILRIEWDSLEGHMQGFRRSVEFKEFFTHVQPFIGQIEEMRHYDKTVVAGTGSATPAA